MPCLEVNTNLPRGEVSPEFMSSTVDLVAKTLGKPKSYVVVHVKTEQLMSWAGVPGPAAVCHLYSVGKIDHASNQKTSGVLFPHIQKHLGIPIDRMYIFFHDSDGKNVGYNGSTLF